jgi:hypothetical protein
MYEHLHNFIIIIIIIIILIIKLPVREASFTTAFPLSSRQSQGMISSSDVKDRPFLSLPSVTASAVVDLVAEDVTVLVVVEVTDVADDDDDGTVAVIVLLNLLLCCFLYDREIMSPGNRSFVVTTLQVEQR